MASSTMQAIQSDPDAKKSYNYLRAKGLRNTDLFEELLRMAADSYDEKPAKWYSGNSKEFATFLRQIEAVTVKIEKLNADPRFFSIGGSSNCRKHSGTIPPLFRSGPGY